MAKPILFIQFLNNLISLVVATYSLYFFSHSNDFITDNVCFSFNFFTEFIVLRGIQFLIIFLSLNKDLNIAEEI